MLLAMLKIRPTIYAFTFNFFFKETYGSGRGDNYTAALYRILLKGFKRNANGSEEPWEKSVICKRLPDSKAQREAYKSEQLFRYVFKQNKIFPFNSPIKLTQFFILETKLNSTRTFIRNC